MISTTETPLDAALSAIDQAIDWNDPKASLVGAKCRALLVGYEQFWRDSGYVPIAVEQMVTAPLRNPETQRNSRTFDIAAKIDVRVEHVDQPGRNIIIDHKSTTEDISKPDSQFWRQLVVEAQPSQYMLLEWLNGRKVDTCIWDVMRKPGISPKTLTKNVRAAIVLNGTYFGRDVSDDERTDIAGGKLTHETLSMYEYRLIRDCTIDRPERYFARRPVPRIDNELIEYAVDLWDWGQEILHARNKNRHPTSSTACMAYHSPCKYLGICSGHDNIDSDNWLRKKAVHSELPLLDGDGRNTLTQSRIKTFQLCRKKHYFAYELGLERYKEDESEALFFGTAWHVGLEAFWRAQLQESPYGNCASEHADNATASHSRTSQT